jgi:ribonuclease H2 subunit A
VTHSITAAEISAAMLHRAPISLNVLSHDAAADMLELVLRSGVRVEQVFVDTVGDPDFYAKKLDTIFNATSGGGGGAAGRGWPISIVVSKKADALYKTVSAGSIAAKVTRDRALRDWVFDEPAFAGVVAGPAVAASAAAGWGESSGGGGGVDGGASPPAESDDSEGGVGDAGGATASGGGGGAASLKRPRAPDADAPPVATPLSMHPTSAGSGYPSDPLTKAWLSNFLDPIFGWPSVARFSWAPAKSALEKDGTRVAWPDEEAIASIAGGQPRLSTFFAASTAVGGGASGGGASGAPPGAAGPRPKWFRQRFLTPVGKL